MPDYTDWPLVADVTPLLTACNVMLRIESEDQEAYIQRKLASVIAEVKERTKRSFVPVEDVRLYDGTGTSEIVVDEMTELEGVAFLYNGLGPQEISETAILTSDQQEPLCRLVYREGSVFPLGRRNVQVTGTFGYAEAVPEDLWEAVAQQTAYRLAAEVSYRPIGRVASTKVGDTQTNYRDDEATMTRWDANYKAAIKRYRRKGTMRAARLAPAMI